MRMRSCFHFNRTFPARFLFKENNIQAENLTKDNHLQKQKLDKRFIKAE